ncbi:DNA polymerase III subunit delta' [Vreelandella utahensis]|uniref:DNA polymerase III subunit delta' n=1 Tax=Vreelandella halophila TaxID=86177 RepID=UPI00098755FA|nr:DNA polymerase III subunit delta' [Halomonas utahensis]
MADPETQPLQSDFFAPWPWQSGVHQQLSQRLREGRFPHALMLLGPAGVGKRQLAVSLASLLLCEAPVNAGEGMSACGECKQCRLLGGEGHPDARRLMPTDQSRYIRIHQVRALGGFVMESPQVARRKVAVIERADQLNLNAANALLKTLEEPPSDTFLLVLQREGQPVLPTIRSRCQILRVEAPGTAEARNWLAERRDEDAAALDQALRWAGGAPLEALRLLEADRPGQRAQCLKALQQALKSEITMSEAVKPFLAMPLTEALDLLQGWALDLARAGADPEAIADSEAAPMLRFLAGRRHPAELTSLHEAIMEVRRGLDYNVNPELELIGVLERWRQLMRRPGVANPA